LYQTPIAVWFYEFATHTPRYYGHRYYRGYWERRRWDNDHDERWEHRGRHHDDDDEQ
jgi:hypothetical protein